MKKLMCGIMVFATLSGLMVPAHAEQITTSKAVSAVPDNQAGQNAKISKEEAKKIGIKFLKDFCVVEVDEKNCSISINYRVNSRNSITQNESYEWDIQYQYIDGNRSYYFMVGIDANSGDVIRYDRNESNMRGDDQPKVAAISEEQAYEKALSFIKMVYPDVSKNIIKEDNDYNKYYYMKGQVPQYYFTFVRQVNGLKFNSNSISISVDGVMGNVTSFDYNWDNNITFPDAKPAIDMDKAYEILYKEADMKLNYVAQYNSNKFEFTKSNNVNLTYGIDFKNGILLDAQTGNMTKPNNISYNVLQTKDLTKEQKEQFLNKWKKPNTNSNELDEKGATESIKSILAKALGQEYEIMNNSVNFSDRNDYYGYGGANKIWSAQFAKKNSEKDYRVQSNNITINGQSGELVFLNMHDFYDIYDSSTFTPKLTWDEAYNKAINIISELYPERVKEITTEQNYVKQYNYVNDVKMPEKNYSFHFTRQINGIPFSDNYISISFDIKTGEVNSISCNWNNELVFQQADKNVVSKDEAKKAYFKIFQPELTYAPVNTSNDTNKPNYEIKLVYRLKYIYGIRSTLIDACTGELFKFTSDMDKNIEAFKQVISGHWGEKELQLMAYQGIINMETFKPDEEITKMDALKLLVNAKGYYPYNQNNTKSLKFTNIDEKNENYNYIQLAVQYGLIDNYAGEFRGEDKITREEMAELIVKLLKFDRLAKCKIYTLPFSDAGQINEDRFGYVAIGTGLGFFSGDNGEFRPKDNTTMAEFAITVYKAISVLKSPEK